MAANVFGNPVTELTLQAMEEYDGKDITAFDTGRVAYDLKDAEDKAVNARAYIENVKGEYEWLSNSTGEAITKCLIYNATGDAITFVSSRDFYGRIFDFTINYPFSNPTRDQAMGAFVGSDDFKPRAAADAPYPVQLEIGQWGALVGSDDFKPRMGVDHPCPVQLENGQWGAFLHVKKLLTASGSSGAVVYRIKGVEKGPDVDCMIAWSTAWGPWNSNHCYAEIRPKGHFNDAVWGKVETKMSNSGHRYVETAGYFRAELNIRNDKEWEAILRVGNPFSMNN